MIDKYSQVIVGPIGSSYNKNDYILFKNQYIDELTYDKDHYIIDKKHKAINILIKLISDIEEKEKYDQIIKPTLDQIKIIEKLELEIKNYKKLFKIIKPKIYKQERSKNIEDLKKNIEHKNYKIDRPITPISNYKENKIKKIELRKKLILEQELKLEQTKLDKSVFRTEVNMLRKKLIINLKTNNNFTLKDVKAALKEITES